MFFPILIYICSIKKGVRILETKRIILIDKNIFFRNGLRDILNNLGNIEIIGTFSTQSECLDTLKQKKTDLIFTDIIKPYEKNIEFIKKTLEIDSTLTIIAYCDIDNSEIVNSIIEAGVKGFLLKSENNIEILKKIISDKTNEHYFSSNIEKEINKLTYLY